MRRTSNSARLRNLGLLGAFVVAVLASGCEDSTREGTPAAEEGRPAPNIVVEPEHHSHRPVVIDPSFRSGGFAPLWFLGEAGASAFPGVDPLAPAAFNEGGIISKGLRNVAIDSFRAKNAGGVKAIEDLSLCFIDASGSTPSYRVLHVTKNASKQLSWTYQEANLSVQPFRSETEKVPADDAPLVLPATLALRHLGGSDWEEVKLLSHVGTGEHPCAGSSGEAQRQCLCTNTDLEVFESAEIKPKAPH